MIQQSARPSAALGAAVSLSALVLAASSPSLAQTYRDSSGTLVPGMVIVDPSGAGPLGTAANPMKISGSFAASLSGFAPTPAYASLSVAAASTSYNVALPSGAVVVVYNTGANDAYVKLGNASVTASATSDVVKAGGWMAFAVGSNTYLAAYATAGATALTLSGGGGLPTGSAGGSSGGNVPTGSAGTPSASVMSIQGVAGGVVVPANQTQLAGTALGAPSTWGTAPSGNVQGVNANVLSLPALPAGANGIGSVMVSSLPSIPAGSNTIGAVTQASGPWTENQTQLAGTSLGAPTAWGTAPSGNVQGVNANVLSLPALPAGSNTIGAVTQASGPWTENQTQINGVAVSTGTGASGTGTQRVAVSTDSPGGAAANPAYVSAINIATAWSEIVPNNTTGLLIASGAHVLYGLDGSNVGSVPLYIKFYDTATAPTCGSGTPNLRRLIPVASTNANGAGTNIPPLAPGGVKFTNGIGLCVTAGLADSDATAPAANAGLLNLGYQ